MTHYVVLSNVVLSNVVLVDLVLLHVMNVVSSVSVDEIRASLIAKSDL